MSKIESLTRAQTKLIDKLAIDEFGLPGIVLMENAGLGISQYLLSLKPTDMITICCGKGNNGGDGYVIARYLDNFNIPVQVFIFANENEIKGDAKIHYNVIKKMGLKIEHLEKSSINHKILLNKLNDSEWIVDGLFGTGLTGKLELHYSDIINTINRTNAKILAIDIPSGLDCDTGNSLGNTIKAAYTCTLISMKIGFLNDNAKEYLSEVKVIELGIPRQIIRTVKAQKNGM